MEQYPIVQAFQQRSLRPIANQFSVKQLGKALKAQSSDPLSFVGAGVQRKSLNEIAKMTPAMKRFGLKQIRQQHLDNAAVQNVEQEMAEYTKKLQVAQIARNAEQARKAMMERRAQAFQRAHAGFNITNLFKPYGLR